MSAEPIRLVLSDMDGTLLRPDHSLAPAVLDAVAALRGAGAHFSLASSRPPRALLPYARQLDLQGPVAAFNGGVLLTPDGQVIEEHFIAADAVEIVMEYFSRHPVALWVFADDQWLLRELTGDYLDVEAHALGYPPVQVEDFVPYLGRAHKIVASSADFALLAHMENQLQPMLKGKALAARSQQYYLDVTALAANKGNALQTLARHWKVSMAQTAALGDGHNDVPMFRQAGLSIAMGQASAEVRAAADVVTTSNREDGVAKAIRDFILPRV